MKLIIYTTSGPKKEIDLADVVALDIEDADAPLFMLHVLPDRGQFNCMPRTHDDALAASVGRERH